MMMSQSQNHHSRRMLPPVNTRKRKLNEADKPDKPDKPIGSNKLLAGYLAHEFLTKGTLLGQKFDPELSRAGIYPDSRVGSRAAEASDVRKEHESYGEVASIMKMDGTHIKGIVNPTQLSEWIRM